MRLQIKLFLTVSIIGLSMMFFPINAIGFDDIDFEFQRNLYFDDTVTPSQEYNMRDSGFSDDGNYPATYSFENDANFSNPIGFTVSEPTGSVNVIPLFTTHKKVVEINDTGASQTIATQTFDIVQVSGTVELWFAISDASETVTISLPNSVSNSILFTLFGGDFYVDDGLSTILLPSAPSIIVNKWYHLSLDFESGVGGYRGLGADTWNVILDGVDYGAFDYRNVATSIISFKAITGSTEANFKFYFDALGYTWTVFSSSNEVIDFTDDTVGQEPNGWTINNDVSTSSLVKASLDGRTKVLEMFDNNGVGSSTVSRELITETVTNIQMDIAVSSVADPEVSYLYFLENDIVIVRMFIQANLLQYDDGGSPPFPNVGFVPTPNIFFILKLVFNDNINEYNIFVNDVLKKSSLSYLSTTIIGIDEIKFMTDDFAAQPPSYSFYQDNIIINAISYEIGGNLLPKFELDGFKEVDKYEFALSEPNILRTIGSSSYGTWTESDSGGNDNVNIQTDPNNNNERVVKISTNNGGDVKGLRKNNFTSTDDTIEITMDFEFIDFSGSTSYNIIVIESSDTNTITAFIFWHNGSLGWFDDIDSSGIPLRDDLTTGIVYSLSLILNYTTDTFLLRWYIDGIIDTFYTRPLIETGKNGLNEIFIRSHWVDNIATMLVYNVGVYENDISESKELGWITYKTGVLNWNSENNNLFRVITSGLSKFGMTERPYNISDSPQYSDDISIFEQQFSNTTTVYNSGGKSFLNITLAQAIFYIFGGGFITTNINIEGVKLVEGVNEYLATYEIGGIEGSESYFFVDINNRLQFIHEVNDDSILEFIQIEFDINNRSSTDSIISFKSRIDNNAFGFFRINYASTSQLFLIDNTQKTKRVVLIDNLVLDSFIILVSDTNKDSVSGITTGFVSDISILDVENAIISVSTLNLIDMIIPLVLIMIPTLIISSYDDRFVIPMFVLMSTILAITSIIPIWLYFIIGISNAMFLFFKKERDEV